MDRRTLLKRMAALPLLAGCLPLLPLLSRSAAATGKPAIARRLRPSDPGWPTPAMWDQLKEQVGGNLIQVKSPLDAAKSGEKSQSAKDFLDHLDNPYYVGDQVGLTEISGWVDAWQSAPSIYAVAAKSASDVAAAVNFAREHNLRLVVKGGGHSYQGTSNAPDSLLVWTRALNKITLHDDFVAQGCADAPQKAVTIESGAVWMDAYNTVVARAGRYVQGGGCATVGVAGLIQSGGFGSFSKRYGMAAGSLLEAEVVTADGAIRTVNKSQEPDLFWSLKGGGGGSFGVVTKVTLKTHDLPEFFGGAGMRIKAASDAAYRRLIGKLVSFYRSSLFNPHWGESISLRPDKSLKVGMVFQGLDQAEAKAVWKPFIDWVEGAKPDYTFESGPHIGTMPARGWWDAENRKKNFPKTVVADKRPDASPAHIWWKDNQGEVGLFMHGYQSLWLPAELLEDDQQDKLADALFAASKHWNVELHCNKGLAGAPEEAIAAARETALNPAVLSAFALAIIAGGDPAFPGLPGHEPDLAAARRDAADISRSMAALQKVVKEPGSYVSESNYHEQSWQQSFWGANYARLILVKDRYDPARLFSVHHGVGSEKNSDDSPGRAGHHDKG